MQPLPNLAKAEGFGVPQPHHGTQRGWQPLDSGTQAMLRHHPVLCVKESCSKRGSC